MHVRSGRRSGEYGRLREVTVAPDGSLWVPTNNTDGRGDPAPGDDRILRVELGDRTTGKAGSAQS